MLFLPPPLTSILAPSPFYPPTLEKSATWSMVATIEARNLNRFSRSAASSTFTVT
jgi:hypothetical protein